MPGDRPDRVERALASGAEAIVLDLEDGVAAACKEAAREQALATLERLARQGSDPAVAAGRRPPLLGLRVSSPATADGVRDLAALLDAPARPDFLVLAKVESAAEVQLCAAALDWSGELVCSVESGAGLERAAEIAAACEQVAALGFGGVDLAAELGAELAWEPLLAARARVVWCAAAAAVAAFDAPVLELDATAALTADCRRAAALGFDGKIAIHPRQVATIRAGFAPSEASIADARAMLATAQDAGAARHRGTMVDRATLRRAARVLARAEGAP